MRGDVGGRRAQTQLVVKEAADVDTVTSLRELGDVDSSLALHVTGPGPSTRHLLRPGQLVRIGRATDSTIIIDDPRASRAHAGLMLGERIAVSDLGSANGTFVGRDRLRAGEERAIAIGEPFFVGDSTLVVRESGLVPPAPERVITWEQLGDSWRRGMAREGGFVVLKARASAGAEGHGMAPILATILGGFLGPPDDWLLQAGTAEVVIGVAADSAAHVAVLERAAIEKLASWNMAANVDALFLSHRDCAAAPDGGLALLRGGGVITLERGAVVVRSPAMETLRRTLVRIAAAPVPVLILGETGVGKDIAASMIHEASPRAGKPLIRLNCASLPEQLLESELFGHERGAFTGAVATKLGLLEAADGGTVFLDEIGELAPALQPKLLRAIESAEIMRIGALRPRPVDVRFVAATNRDLSADVDGGRFRRDLFHRLACIAVTVPPLRHRREELQPLARLFLDSACARFGVPRRDLSPASFALLEAYPWPGNIRELRNALERAVLLGGGARIEPEHLGLRIREHDRAGIEWGHREKTMHEGHALAATSDQAARIQDALLQCGGNQSRAARLLGIPRRTLVRRIAALGLPRPQNRRDE